MFDPGEYWRTKMERKRLAKSFLSVMAMSFLTGFFEPPERFHQGDKPDKRHARSAKERRIRRMKHKSMMRNAA